MEKLLKSIAKRKDEMKTEPDVSEEEKACMTLIKKWKVQRYTSPSKKLRKATEEKKLKLKLGTQEVWPIGPLTKSMLMLPER